MGQYQALLMILVSLHKPSEIVINTRKSQPNCQQSTLFIISSLYVKKSHTQQHVNAIKCSVFLHSLTTIDTFPYVYIYILLSTLGCTYILY